MATPYVGEIRMFAGNFPPQGWMFCDGALLPIAQYDTLFNLIGTTYGGDGQSTFALPDLRGRIPLHQGGAYVIGEPGGAEQVTLTLNQIPQHTHVPQVRSDSGDQATPVGGTWAASPLNQYSTNAATDFMSPKAIGQTGGNQPHNNLMPFLPVSFIISLFGIFPSQ